MCFFYKFKVNISKFMDLPTFQHLEFANRDEYDSMIIPLNWKLNIDRKLVSLF